MRETPTPGSATLWRRYRRFVAGMSTVAAVAVAAALAALAASGVVLRPSVVGAVAIGVGGMLLLAGALMGLVFLSARSGHDDEVERTMPDRAAGRRRWP